MKVLSIDIGIKNLAFCLLVKQEAKEKEQENSQVESSEFYIKKWDVINICEKQTFHCNFIEKNQGNSQGAPCNKPAKFQKNNQCFCLKHSKKQPFLIPSAELKTSFINKQKIQKLMEIANKYKISYEKNVKKADLINMIHDYIHNTCFEEVVVTKASNTDLVTIGINIMTYFNTLFTEEDQIDYVIIENQISPIANRMKTIQGMIAQYFIMSDVSVEHIEFVSSINKLKDFNYNAKSDKSEKLDKSLNQDKSLKPAESVNKDKSLNQDKSVKLTYGQRKKLGITKCLDILTSDYRFQNNIDFFKSHKKQDDLADSFLQGLWFIHHKI
jgi:hypothetical protein